MDGLANNTVRQIIQDSKGQIWIATSNGVSKYNGVSFTNYRPSHNKEKISIADQRVKNIYEDDAGHIWIVSPTNQFACFDLNSDCFIDYAKAHIQIPEDKTSASKTSITDKEGRVWKVTSNDGLYITNSATGEVEHFSTTSPSNSLPTNALKCIFQDQNGVIWIGTDNLGISQLEVFQNDGIEYLLEGEYIRMLMPLTKNLIAVGNKSGDLWLYDDSLSNVISKKHYENNTYYIHQDSDGTIWRGTKGAGLFVNSKQYYNEGMANPDDICNYQSYKLYIHNDIYSILADHKGNIWIGTLGGGLCIASINNGQMLFRSFFEDDYGTQRIRSLVEDESGNIWAATSGGVLLFNPDHFLDDTTKFTHLCTENERILSNEVRTLFKASDGKIYIAETGEGFCIYENRENGPTLINRIGEGKDSLINSMVQCFVEDEQGIIWISTEFGISKYNPHTGKCSSYFFSSTMLSNVYSENCGVRLSDGRIAFGTNNGIVVINPSVYNSKEKASAISPDDVTINGLASKHNIEYIMSKWWKSLWAIIIYVIVATAIVFFWFRVKKNNKRFLHAIRKLKLQKDDIKEKYTREVHINRNSNKYADADEFIEKVNEIIEKELANPSVKADDLANLMGYGRTIFFNKMKEVTGYSPKEYLNRIRITKAAYLISSTDLTFSEISLRVGINDPLYFSRIFKSVYGCTPTQWRKRV